MNRPVVLLCSGGLDSTVLAYKLAAENVPFIPLFINYGHHSASTELSTARAVLPPPHGANIEILDLSSVYKHSNSKLIRPTDLWNENAVADDFYVPLRNLLLFTVGAAFAQTISSSKVYSAIINTVRAKEVDCSVDFFSKLNSIMDLYGGIEILMPFRYMSKSEVAQLGVKLGAPIGSTFSCQASPSVACGACPNCVERLEALDSLLEVN